MIRFFKTGDQVPEWLMTIRVKKPELGSPDFTFAAPTLVVHKSGAFLVWSFWRTSFHVNGKNQIPTIKGQGKGVYHHDSLLKFLKATFSTQKA